MIKGDRVLAAREAGATMRCHTIPHHGEYSVAVHCYNVVSMIFIFHPNPSIALIEEALWHDAGERWVGDIPAPAKWGNEELDIASRIQEARARSKYGLKMHDLGPINRSWLHVLDCLEFWLWCQDQHAMGNRNMLNAYKAIWEVLSEIIPKTAEFEEVVHFFKTHSWHRLEEGIEPDDRS